MVAATAFPIPHDLTAEAAVVSAMIIDPDCIPEIASLLAPDNFYADANRQVFAVILGLAEARKTVDIVTVARTLRDSGRLEQIGGLPYLAQLADATPAVAHVSAHAQVVREKWRLREFIRRCLDLSAQAPTEGDVQDFLERAERDIADLAEEQGRDESVFLRDVLLATLQIVEAAQKRGGEVTGTATGFTRLDRQTSGLHAGDLYIVAARPGMGKTSFVLNMAVNVALRDDGVLFCSLEMPRAQLGLRVLSAEAGIELSAIRNGSVVEPDWPKLHEAAARTAQLNILIDDEASISLHRLAAKIKRAKSKLKVPLRVVIVDYLQLMNASRSAKSREEGISELTRSLKALAKDEGVAIVALSQLNRAVETRPDKRPQLSDLRESGAIEQDADCVMFIYREEYYKKDTEAKGIAEIIVAKQRNGPTGTVLCKFTSNCTRFDNLEAEEFDIDQFDDFGDERFP